jgi:hypothetical protein
VGCHSGGHSGELEKQAFQQILKSSSFTSLDSSELGRARVADARRFNF